MTDPVREWQRRAREEAEKHDHHSLKKAVQKVTPTDEEARAIYQLYASCEDDIEQWCKEAIQKAQGADTPPVEDLKGEAYILFQRTLVRFDPDKGSLRTYLQHHLRGRIRDYLQTTSHEREEREEQRPDEASTAPKFHLDELYGELVDEGRVPQDAASLYDRLHPERG